MGAYPTGPEECAPPECEPRVTSLGDPGPIAVFVFWGIVVAYLALYFCVKLIRSRRHYVPSTKLELTASKTVEMSKTSEHNVSQTTDQPLNLDSQICCSQ